MNARNADHALLETLANADETAFAALTDGLPIADESRSSVALSEEQLDSVAGGGICFSTHWTNVATRDNNPCCGWKDDLKAAPGSQQQQDSSPLGGIRFGR